jgi:internalin A
MKRIVLVALALTTLLFACDEDKKKAELLAATKGPEDAAVATAMPAMSVASAAPSASAAPVKAKECPPSGAEVTIPDADLEAAIRFKAQKPKGPLKPADLAGVSSINLADKHVDELDACTFPKLTGLHHLYLGPGKLRDLSPLENLTKIESLRASINEVENLKPLEKLTAMDRLDLGRTHVRDLTPLANLVNLTELQLDDTEVSDITPLAKCKKLQKLSLKHTNVTDVSPLKELKDLKFLYVEGCAIANLDALSALVAHGLKVVTK